MLQWLQDIVIVAFDLDNGQNAARNIICDISPLLNDVGRIHKFSYPREPSTILISDPKTIENFIPPNKQQQDYGSEKWYIFPLLYTALVLQYYSAYTSTLMESSIKLYLLEIYNEFYNIPKI